MDRLPKRAIIMRTHRVRVSFLASSPSRSRPPAPGSGPQTAPASSSAETHGIIRFFMLHLHRFTNLSEHPVQAPTTQRPRQSPLMYKAILAIGFALFANVSLAADTSLEKKLEASKRYLEVMPVTTLWADITEKMMATLPASQQQMFSSVMGQIDLSRLENIMLN